MPFLGTLKCQMTRVAHRLSLKATLLTLLLVSLACLVVATLSRVLNKPPERGLSRAVHSIAHTLTSFGWESKARIAVSW